ncbi:hypothetical protein [Kocuria atrinae]|uniref:hypothetical protein n=1 Tax=Kocuria atrinae TaxID=592377 RepID=UPI000316C780|nr:hypothetical protein [Kocuria atrinae]
MAAERTTRAWPWVIAILAIALVAVLAIGAWATWRPLSEYDAARLTARDIVTSVDESSRDDVPRETVDRQLSALGPAATPAQRDRLDEQSAQTTDSSTASGSPAAEASEPAPADVDLPSAVSRMADLASNQEDPELAATMSGIAASWSAVIAREDPTAQPLMRSDAPEEPAAAGAPDRDQDDDSSAESDERCTPELTAVATQVDRALFTAQSAEARGTDSSDTAQALDEWQENLERIQDQPAVMSLYECQPRPARGGYEVPRDMTEDPAAAAGEVARDVSEYSQSAIAAVTPTERAWLLDLLESSARAQALLQPSDPVPALVGEHLATDR